MVAEAISPKSLFNFQHIIPVNSLCCGHALFRFTGKFVVKLFERQLQFLGRLQKLYNTRYDVHSAMLILVLVLVLKDSLRTYFKCLSLSWSLGVRSLSLSLSLWVRSLSWSLWSSPCNCPCL